MALKHFDSSLLIGRQRIELKHVNSTNEYSLNYISKSKPIEGTVISASYQTKGRGQIGRFWESEEGKNILCSTILMPDFLEATDQFSLNMAISLALHDLITHFLDEEGLCVKIKWPNDIYVNDSKIAGILIHNILKGKSISTSVIGTGININQIDFSKEIPNPTSLTLLTQSALDLNLIYGWLFRFMTARYLQLKSGKIEALKLEYLSHLYRSGEWCEFLTKTDVVFKGRINGIDDIGQLRIELENKTVKSFGFREIKFLI